MNTPRAITLLSIPLVLSGCYATTVRSGLTPQPKPSIEHDEQWHHGVVLGIAEISGPYDLQEICPNGWAEVETHTSFINGFVDLITGGIYNPQTVTVRCAVPNASPTPQDPPTSAPSP